MLAFTRSPFLVLYFSYCTLVNLLMILSIILLDIMMILLSNLHVIRHLICELQSNLKDTVNWGRKWLVDINAGEIQLVLFDWSNDTGAIDVEIDGSVLEKKLSLKMLGLTFFSKLDWVSYIISIGKMEPWFVLESFFLLRLLYIIINLLYGHAWDTVFMSGMMHLAVTWNYWISYQNWYTGLLISHMLFLLILWFIVKMHPS